MLLLSSADFFFPNYVFKTILSGTPSACRTVLIWSGTDVLSQNASHDIVHVKKTTTCIRTVSHNYDTDSLVYKSKCVLAEKQFNHFSDVKLTLEVNQRVIGPVIAGHPFKPLNMFHGRLV